MILQNKSGAYPYQRMAPDFYNVVKLDRLVKIVNKFKLIKILHIFNKFGLLVYNGFCYI
jgi:hypothetical protein